MEETAEETEQRLNHLMYELSIQLNLTMKIQDEIQTRQAENDPQTLDLNMIQYFIDPIIIAQSTIKHYTAARNNSTLDVVNKLRQRLNFFFIYNMIEDYGATNLKLEATTKLCLDRHAVRLQAIEQKLKDGN